MPCFYVVFSLRSSAAAYLTGVAEIVCMSSARRNECVSNFYFQSEYALNFTENSERFSTTRIMTLGGQMRGECTVSERILISKVRSAK